MKDITIPLPKLPPRFDRPVLALKLLLGSRTVRIILIDSFLVFGLLVSALFEGGRASHLYVSLVIIPLVLLGSMILSETIALERDAGTLELALTARSRYYFEWHVGVIIILLMAQGWTAMIFSRLFIDRFPLTLALIQTTTISIFFGAIALFWMTRLRQAGSVLFASILTFLLLGKWTLSNPISVFGDTYVGIERAAFFAWLSPNLFFIFGSAILYAYARRALRNPETLMAR